MSVNTTNRAVAVAAARAIPRHERAHRHGSADSLRKLARRLLTGHSSLTASAAPPAIGQMTMRRRHTHRKG